MRRFNIQCPSVTGFYAVQEYAANRREALRQYRERWTPERRRLPAGVAIWESI